MNTLPHPDYDRCQFHATHFICHRQPVCLSCASECGSLNVSIEPNIRKRLIMTQARLAVSWNTIFRTARQC